jgi:hypothetical protein
MDRKTMSAAFNEWMRRYTEEPERFEASFQSVMKFLAERSDGKEPTYGETCAEFMEHLASELTNQGGNVAA